YCCLLLFSNGSSGGGPNNIRDRVRYQSALLIARSAFSNATTGRCRVGGRSLGACGSGSVGNALRGILRSDNRSFSRSSRKTFETPACVKKIVLLVKIEGVSNETGHCQQKQQNE